MTVIPPTPWQEDVSCRVRPHGTCTQGQSDQGKARVKWEELSLCGDKRVDRLAPDGERVTLAWGAAWEEESWSDQEGMTWMMERFLLGRWYIW